MTEKRRVLFLDDRSKRFKAAIEKYKDDDLTIVCTVKECCEKIANEDWDLISLDHDLNFENYVDRTRPDCGMEVIRFIEKHIGELMIATDIQRSDIIVHSSNRLAAKEMVMRLQDLSMYFSNVRHERFSYD